MKKRGLQDGPFSSPPQIIHIGFLFILFAHLVSSIGGFKNYGVITEGTIINVGSDNFVRFKRIEIDITQRGIISDWAIEVIKYSKTNKVYTIRPNEPLFIDGVGIYVRDIQAYPFKAALIEVSREPGAIWALLGAILFVSGTVTLMILKLRKE